MKKYKVREVIKLLEADGWVKLKGSGGDHRQFKHSTKKGRVTVRGHESEVLSQFLLNSIWKQEGVSKCTPSFFYAQSPDFHKLGLCYYLKILYL